MNNIDCAWLMSSPEDSDIKTLCSLGCGIPSGFIHYLELEKEFDFSPIQYNPSLPMSDLEKTCREVKLDPNSDITLLVYGNGESALRYYLGWFIVKGDKYKTLKEAVLVLLEEALLEVNQPQYYISSLDWECGIECLCNFIDLIKEKL